MADKKVKRRTYGSPNVDGFRDENEENVAYCPREKKKKSPEEHRKCEFHDSDASAEASEEAAQCAFDEEEEEKDGDEEKDEEK